MHTDTARITIERVLLELLVVSVTIIVRKTHVWLRIDLHGTGNTCPHRLSAKDRSGRSGEIAGNSRQFNDMHRPNVILW